MEGLFLRADHWHAIAKYLSVIDLCHMMQLSQSSFYLWVADRAWAHQRRRICTRFPALNAVFDLYCEEGASGQHTSKRAEKSNSNKKRKTAWITPRKGIWYTFKRWLMMGTTMKGIKSLCKREEMHPIVISVVRLNLPCNDLITKTSVKRQMFNRNTNTYKITIWWGEKKYWCRVKPMCNTFNGRFFYEEEDGEWFNESELYDWGVTGEFWKWEAFLFERRARFYSQWSKLFENLIKNGGE